MSFPEPDYKGLIEDGASPFGVSFLRALRESIPVKPQRRGIDMWAALVREFRNLGERVIRGDLPEDRIREIGERPGSMRALREAIDKADLYMAAGHDISLKKLEFGLKRWRITGAPQGHDVRENWEVAPVRRKADRFTPKALVSSPDRAEALRIFSRLVEQGGLEDLNAKKKKPAFSIYSYRNAPGVFWIGKKIGKNHIDLERFDTQGAAMAYRREHAADLEAKLAQMKNLPNYRNERNRDRTGPDYRNGKDVTPEDFMKAFAFRGVQFGNYVEKDRRQRDLNHSYDALMDLAFILEMDSTAISLDGRLGLAFGARGRGGIDPASAHFEPVECVINLTKMNGAGSLAHEWLHGVDNHISHMAGRSSGMISEFMPPRAGQEMRDPGRGREDIPDGVLSGLNVLNDAINRTGVVDRCRQLDRMRSSPYYQLREEILARTFECYVIDRLAERGITNDYLANIMDEASYEALAAMTEQPEGRYPYLKDEEKPSVFEAYDALMKGSALVSGLMPEGGPVNAGPALPVDPEIGVAEEGREPPAVFLVTTPGLLSDPEARVSEKSSTEDDLDEDISWM